MGNTTAPKAARTTAAAPSDGEDPAKASLYLPLYLISWRERGLADTYVEADEIQWGDNTVPTLLKTEGKFVVAVAGDEYRMIGRVAPEKADELREQWYEEAEAESRARENPPVAESARQEPGAGEETREAGMPGVAVRFPPRLMSAVELLAGIDGKDPEMWVRDLVDIAVEVQMANTQVPGPAPVAERAQPELPWGSYEIRFAGGARTVVQAKELTEYTDGTWSLEADGRTVGLGSRAGVASIARLN